MHTLIYTGGGPVGEKPLRFRNVKGRFINKAPTMIVNSLYKLLQRESGVGI